MLARVLRLDTADAGQGKGPFTERRTDELIVSGADDRHLDFRAVFAVREDSDGGAELVLLTVVRRHNRLGRAYFALIRPFHRRIVPAILRRALAHPPRMHRERQSA